MGRFFFIAVLFVIQITIELQAQCITLSYQTTSYYGSQITCHGASDGGITVSATGGNSPLTYSWSNGMSGNRINGLAAGNYIVTVSDTSGCIIVDSITLTDPPLITFNITYVMTAFGFSLKCYGDSNGRVTALATGGTDKILYTWSNGGNTAFQSDLSAANYYVTATDANGCSASTVVEISQPPALFVRVNAVSTVNPAGASNGSAQAVAIGGCPGYEYLWSDGQTNALAVNLSVGNYTITLSDYYSCTATGRVSILGPRSTGVGTSVSTGVSIGGGRTGSGGRRLIFQGDNNVYEEQSKPFMPQLLSPYSHQNNVFNIKNLDQFQNCELMIFDMNGMLMYSDNNYNNNWTGVDNFNRSLPPAVYVAVLKYSSEGISDYISQKFILNNN
jgi:hypothetical protein